MSPIENEAVYLMYICFVPGKASETWVAAMAIHR